MKKFFIIIENYLNLLFSLNVVIKKIILFCIDFILNIISTYLSFIIINNFTYAINTDDLYCFFIAGFLFYPFFVFFDLYSNISRFFGLIAIQSIFLSSFLYAITLNLLLYLIKFNFAEINYNIFSIFSIQPIIFFVFCVLSRLFFVRLIKFRIKNIFERNILIYGAGEAGAQSSLALMHSDKYQLVGFIDDDVSKKNSMINNFRVHHTRDIEAVLNSNKVSDILLSIPSLSFSQKRQIISNLEKFNLNLLIVPDLSDILSGKVSLTDIKQLDINSLLDRQINVSNYGLSNNFFNKTVLITGGGGSIGSELCRQILNFNPKKIIIVDNNEFSLYKINTALENLKNKKNITTIIKTELINIGDFKSLKNLFYNVSPNFVYHAAAFKHVALVENNLIEAVKNNVFGTLNIINCSIEFNVNEFVLVSTDKAVRPSNIMGATKRIAEMIVQAKVSQINDKKKFSIVRFGNVLDSSGSVISIFNSQIASGGPITVTHSEVSRYFMTIPEAASLIIHAGSFSKGGEVFVLDMGKPIKIIDLARKIIRLSGLKEKNEFNIDGDIEISIIGLRKGEKIYEELLIGDNPVKTTNPYIMKINEEYLDWTDLDLKLKKLKEQVEIFDQELVLSSLKNVVNDFNHLNI